MRKEQEAVVSLAEQFNLFIEGILGSNPNVLFSEVSRTPTKVTVFAEMNTEGLLLKS